jgi:hypothetical protein
MSACIVEDAQIDLIVSGAINKKIVFDRSTFGEGEISPEVLGQILVDANYKSVNYRYGTDHKPHKYVFRGIENAADNPWNVLSAIDGYSYQACEPSDWINSSAKHFVDQIYKRVIQSFAEYSKAKGWAFSEEDSQGRNRSLLAFLN